jgi:hypothetical protein
MLESQHPSAYSTSSDTGYSPTTDSRSYSEQPSTTAKSKKKYRGRKRDPKRQPEEESPRDSGSADDEGGPGGQVQVIRRVLRREYQNLEPVRYPVEPLSSEEDSADTSGSGTQADDEDIDVSREVDETLVNPQGTEERRVDGTEGLEVEAATHLDPDDRGV